MEYARERYMGTAPQQRSPASHRKGQVIARPLKKSLCAFHSNAICACLCPQNIAFSRLVQMFYDLCRYLMHCVQIPDADGQWADKQCNL